MDNLTAYILMALVMSMLPGTDTILIMKNTLSYGGKAGYYTILGMATGLFFWTAIAVLGLSLVIAQSVFLFNIIKYLGAAYLIYLGIMAFFTRAGLSGENFKLAKKSVHSIELKKHYKESYFQGAISNILNPKTVLVYVTFMPQFINLHGNINQQLIILGAILTCIAVGWFLIVVYLIDHIKQWFKKPVFQQAFQKCAGILLIGLGVRTAL